MKITEKELQSIARLARLEVPEGKVQEYLEHFNGVFDDLDLLEKLDTSAVEPTIQVVEYGNIMREDIVKPSLTQEEALLNAPEKKDGGYLVPRVMEGAGA